MYGKNLDDYPERFQAFLDVLAGETPEDINAGFMDCLKTNREFPVPADVLAASRAAATKRWQVVQEQRQLEQRRKDDEIKNQRFLTDGKGEKDLNAEWLELLRDSKLRAM